MKTVDVEMLCNCWLKEWVSGHYLDTLTNPARGVGGTVKTACAAPTTGFGLWT